MIKFFWVKLMNRLKEIYAEISSDGNIHDIYRQVDECDNNMWALHGLQHIKNVVNMVENVLEKLNYNEEVIYKAKICAFLHDIGSVQGKQGHAQRSVDFCKNYLDNFNLSKEEKEEIIYAILNHGSYVEGGGIILAALVFSDKIDIDKTRLGEEGYAIEGMRQLQWIDNIIVDINNKLTVSFKCNEGFNRKEFEEFYFCEKVFDAIKSFARVIGKSHIVYINNEIWNFGV